MSPRRYMLIVNNCSSIVANLQSHPKTSEIERHAMLAIRDMSIQRLHEAIHNAEREEKL